MEETKKKFNPLIIIGIVLALVIMVMPMILNPKKSPVPVENIKVDNSETSTISIEEVSKHSTKDNCWLAIEGEVYDVTTFAPKHPGEEAIFFGCGKDATEMFNKRQDGTSHSDRARVQLEKLKIGTLSSS